MFCCVYKSQNVAFILLSRSVNKEIKFVQCMEIVLLKYNNSRDMIARYSILRYNSWLRIHETTTYSESFVDERIVVGISAKIFYFNYPS